MLSKKQQKEVEALRRKVIAAHKRLGSTDKVARELKIGESSVRRHLKAANGNSSPPPKTVGRSVEEFRAAHDKNFILPRKIKDALAKLGRGWAYEMEFVKLAGVSLGDLANYRGMFDQHIVLVERTRRAWAGTKTVAEELREMIG